MIAEDLVAREPWDRSNIERFRRALALLGEADIDAIIAERLSGQSPFTSTDFMWPADPGGSEMTPMPVAPRRRRPSRAGRRFARRRGSDHRLRSWMRRWTRSRRFAASSASPNRTKSI